MKTKQRAKSTPRRKIPLRTCVGCRSTKPKWELIRIVRAPSGEVSVDPSGRANGRGAYVCPNEGCFFQAVKKQRLAKALVVNISEDTLRQLETDFLQDIRGGEEVAE